LMYDVRSRGAESYIQLAKEIIERTMPELAVKVQEAEPEEQPPIEDEKQVVNAPRWKRWKERNKLIAINIQDR